MALWHRKKDLEGQHGEYVAQDGSVGPGGKKHGRPRFILHVLLLGFCGALLLGVTGVVSGPTMVEKALTGLITPIGLVWLALTLLVYFCLIQRQVWPALIGFFCWLTLTLCGNALIGGMLIQSLEAPYQDINVLELEPMDVVVILGGGTNQKPNGKPQLTFGGDRVRVAASLFHRGLVDRLMCTGSQVYRSSDQDLDPREEASAILVSLGVPGESLLEMEGANKNTSEEMQSLKKWLADQEKIDIQKTGRAPESGQPNRPRVGIITSAWHMSRALRLAKANGLEVIPVPADFLSEPVVPSHNWVIPNGYYLNTTGLFVKENLARIVGR